jgi:hypothetical protein
MIAAGLWKDRRAVEAYSPTAVSPGLRGRADPDRRNGALVVRGPGATMHPTRLYRDASSRLMHRQFVESESTFDYFAATWAYLERHGKRWRFAPTSTACSGSTRRMRPAAMA